jgi:hypothetical protein
MFFCFGFTRQAGEPETTIYQVPRSPQAKKTDRVCRENNCTQASKRDSTGAYDYAYRLAQKSSNHPITRHKKSAGQSARGSAVIRHAYHCIYSINAFRTDTFFKVLTPLWIIARYCPIVKNQWPCFAATIGGLCLITTALLTRKHTNAWQK